MGASYKQLTIGGHLTDWIGATHNQHYIFCERIRLIIWHHSRSTWASRTIVYGSQIIGSSCYQQWGLAHGGRAVFSHGASVVIIAHARQNNYVEAVAIDISQFKTASSLGLGIK